MPPLSPTRTACPSCPDPLQDSDVEFQTQEGNFDNRPNSIYVYAPCRTVVVYAPAEYVDAQVSSTAIELSWG